MDEPTADEGRPAETLTQKQDRLFGGGRDTGRIEAFSDGVFAIALTLLVLDLRVPELHPGETVWEAVVRLWPQFLGYVLSFLIIAINWVFHHRKFRAIVRYDTRLIWINLLFLFFVALVPFPTSLLSEYAPDPAAVALYAASVAVLGILGTVMWQYAARSGFLSGAVDRRLIGFTTANNLVVPVVFLASIPVALFGDPAIAMYSWILTWPASWLVSWLWGRRPAGADADEPVKD